VTDVAGSDEFHRFTLADHLDYTKAELQAVAAEHGVHVKVSMTHPEMVAALKAAGVELPAKPPQRVSHKPLARRGPRPRRGFRPNPPEGEPNHHREENQS
jgi:hypothetical protein